MDFDDLQRNWDAFGRLDPFWAILTDPTRRGNRWDPAEFFATGQEEVTELLRQANRLGLPARRHQALDFGCGVGRLTQALLAYVDNAVGVDIAPSMIDLARRYNTYGTRCRYAVNSRPDLADFPAGFFDVVYTGRVLQHMEPRYAEAYVREFVRVLAAGGYLSFDLPSEHGHFPTGQPQGSQPADAYRAAVRVLSSPSIMACGERIPVLVEVMNVSTVVWTDGQLNVGNHWAYSDGSIAVRDDARARIELPWAPGQRRQLQLAVTAPHEPGTFRLQCDVVEEGVTWFADAGSTLSEAPVLVGQADRAMTVAEAAAIPQQPTMELHAVERSRVEQLLRESNGRLLTVDRVHHCGPRWLAFRYNVTRD